MATRSRPVASGGDAASEFPGKRPLFNRPLTHDWTLWVGLGVGLYLGVTWVWAIPGLSSENTAEGPPAPFAFVVMLGWGLLLACALAEIRRLKRFLTRRRSM